ncbi:hypothetical protein BZM27_05825 [Paraburkholderia steynii]|uniref:Uncharacterized protein n=1 Tax=Paraburkholderia steynii TaxID=1245441 RepID=A0A4R0XPH6_9BURK|nr:hypothetical protein BZM27_05825 [Paraburkholderia steynii]
MKPFNLEAAKRGEPIMATPAGDLGDCYPVVYVGIDSHETIWAEDNAGCTRGFSADRLRMASKPKRIVFVNVYDAQAEDSIALDAGAFQTEAEALSNADGNRLKLLAIAVPIEIEV